MKPIQTVWMRFRWLSYSTGGEAIHCGARSCSLLGWTLAAARSGCLTGISAAHWLERSAQPIRGGSVGSDLRDLWNRSKGTSKTLWKMGSEIDYCSVLKIETVSRWTLSGNQSGASSNRTFWVEKFAFTRFLKIVFIELVDYERDLPCHTRKNFFSRETHLSHFICDSSRCCLICYTINENQFCV